MVSVPIPSFSSYTYIVAESLQFSKYPVFKKRHMFECALAPANLLVKFHGKISVQILKYFVNAEPLGMY